MLGRLLSTLNPASYSSRNGTTHLESVTEEEHTSGLLFPDANLLRYSNSNVYPLQATFNAPNASTVGAYDDRGGLDLDPIKDFRVIIAQNALGDRDPCVLLDTRAPASDRSSDPTQRGAGLRRPDSSEGKQHYRTASGFSGASWRSYNVGSRASYTEQSSYFRPSAARLPSQGSPASTGAFSRARRRSSTMTPLNGGSYDSYHSKYAADSNDSGLLNCIFGSSAFSNHGSSSKMHIISADDEAENTGDDGVRTPLSRAHTTGESSGFSTPGWNGSQKRPSKVTVLLTRMFSVNLPDGDDTSEGRRDSVASVFQESLPPEAGSPSDFVKARKVKEKKTPMYAVAITIQIPLQSRTSGRASSLARAYSQGPDSPVLTTSCSLDSGQNWRGKFLDGYTSLAAPPANLDERIDLLVDHWDVINRTLSHLERLARREILFLLKKVDALSGSYPKPAKAPNMQRINQTIVHLPANIMSVNPMLKEEATRSALRMSRALQTPYVVTGQSRWGVWREEGRSIVRTLDDKEHGFFFLVLITAFLGNHTEWLNILGPEWYRRRQHLMQKAQQDSDPLMSQRTLIISPDKMTARRLIFLLAAFLPASKQRLEQLSSPARPGTATSALTFSESPPSVPMLRREGLQRKGVERRSRAQQSTNGHMERSASASSNETSRLWTEDGGYHNGSFEYHSRRRGSDARSLGNVPLRPGDAQAVKSGLPTISAAAPSSAIPVPHFASRSNRTSNDGAGYATTAGEHESLASETLWRSLRRSEGSTIGPENNSENSRRGYLSDFLSSRRDPYAGRRNTGSIAGRRESHNRSVSAVAQSPYAGKSPNSLQRMVGEVSSGGPFDSTKNSRPEASGNISIPNAGAGAGANGGANLASSGPQESPPVARQAKESPLKLSVRAEDGVVDVDLPLPGFVSSPSSGDSLLGSPEKAPTSLSSIDGMTSTHSMHSAIFHCSQREYDPKVNVAGWLKSFHEDFLLQAVRPYSTLEADIKRAMQAEPTPNPPFTYGIDEADRWVDVATTVIADTRTFTVKRLRLKRRINVNDETRRNSASSAMQRQSPGGSSASPMSNFLPNNNNGNKSLNNGMDEFSGNNNHNDQSEIFVEEPIMEMDGTFSDAVERILVQGGQYSPGEYSPIGPIPTMHSRTNSPAPRRRTTTGGGVGEERRNTNPNTSSSEATAQQQQQDESSSTVVYPEVPKWECKKIILGALEEVARSVTAEHCHEDMDSEIGISDRERKRSSAGIDNTLREGVRRWLLNIAEAW